MLFDIARSILPLRVWADKRSWTVGRTHHTFPSARFNPAFSTRNGPKQAKEPAGRKMDSTTDAVPLAQLPSPIPDFSKVERRASLMKQEILKSPSGKELSDISEL
ncbi:MAG: hypothetical protein KGM93_14685 [Sphingomonadales bacterium]|nr:hypothetical protein [Sphingomonadales bacterium]